MITKKRLILSIHILIIQTLVLFGNVACTTRGYVSEEINGPLSEIQKIVSENLPNGTAYVSTNQRNFYSKEFTAFSNKRKTPSIMRISILGDRRPYSLQIQVNEAAKSKNAQVAFEQGQELENSESYARRAMTKIKEQLTKRLNNKNLFDDFRPF